PYVEINPADAENLGVSTGRWAVVESRRGSARARAFVTPTVPAGQLFLPMHDGATNQLTLSSFDPESRQPAYKACAAQIRPAVDGEIPNDHDTLPTH
ncbi:MAG: molybdopterin dinucleotide binding domain-containing protein, partial [Isosphaeraceae bacterium]